MSLRIKTVRIQQAFPPNDLLATCIARICILREDMMLELLAFLEEDMGKVDRPNVNARMFYFIRNLIRTQNQLYSAIHNIRSNKQFKELLSRHPIEERQEFDTKFNALSSHHELLKEVRNDVGGHIRHDAVHAALDGIDHESFGLFQVGDSALETQYGFASNIVVAMMMKGVTKQELTELTGSKKWKDLRTYLALASLADMCFVIYALDRGIAPF